LETKKWVEGGSYRKLDSEKRAYMRKTIQSKELENISNCISIRRKGPGEEILESTRQDLWGENRPVSVVSADEKWDFPRGKKKGSPRDQRDERM